MEAFDLDSLLQSHSEFDSDEEHSAAADVHHSRTVDEILLNHSSSSPSPPSSPSNSTHHYFRNYNGNDAVSTSSSSSNDPRLSYSSSANLSVVQSDKYSSAAAARTDVGTNSNRTNHGARVLPQLFGGGAIRSNAKPGAALAAAFAAARLIPTPHATAIKLQRRDSTSTTLQTTRITTAADDSSLSPSAMASRSSENKSDAGADLDGFVKLEQFQSAKLLSVDEEADSSQHKVLKQAAELANAMTLTGATDDVDQDSTRLNLELHNDSVAESENSILVDTNVSEQELSLSFHVNNVVPEVIRDDESSATLLIPMSSEDTSRVEEASDFENIISEPSDSDDVSSEGDVTDTVEDMAAKSESNSNDANSHNIPHSSPKPLNLAEEIEKKEAYTALHYEEGAAAQPMRLEGLRKDSTVLGYFDVSSNNAITRTISSQGFRRDNGSPQVVAVHFNYIAVGMSKGSIYVLPSKYTVHQDDNMDAKMTLLGLQGDRSLVPVTSMCFNQQGDLLFAGYGDGHYTVWDVQKASALKVITEHRAPVVHMMYLGQENTQVTRQFNVVSGDSKGVVKLIRFSVVPWLNRISYTKSMKLLDETTSRVVCASPLLHGEGHGGATISSHSGTVSTNSMIDEGVVIFITHQAALVAKVSPAVEVYAQIPKPDDVREGAMPYAAWRCMTLPSSSSSENGSIEPSEKVSLLAIAWDQKIQVAKLVKSKINVIEKWTIESPTMGLAWLDDEMLVVLTLSAHICLFSKDGSMIHQTSFSTDGFQRNDLVSHHLYFTNALGNPENAYHSSVAVRGANIYILGPINLVVSRLLSWKDRIEVLRKAGDWMGALNMAMTLYDGKSHGVIDLPRNLDDIQRTIIPYLVELLQAYVSEVFSYLSVASYKQNTNMDESDEVKEQYTRVGGVAVEFCVHIRRTDILFDDIVSKFDEAHHKETFLELLEPYILKDMLGLLPPGIMQALVEHYSKKGWLQRIEQCVLHMDILSLDFNQVVRLCREHRLHGALIYLFNKGLDDFRTPLEELLLVLRNSSRESVSSLGYKILVYLKYCFQGLAFPPGRGSLATARLPSLRIELVRFLLETSIAPNAWGLTSLSSDKIYPNLLHLLELDTESTMDVLRCAFTEDEILLTLNDSVNSTIESAESQKLIQKIVDILADILEASYFQTGSSESVEIWPSKKDVVHIYDFIAYYVACERANVSKDILSQIFEYLTSESNILHDLPLETIQIVKRRENQLLSLLEVLPEAQWDVPYLLHLCEKAQFHKVCGCIHAIRNHYVAAMESYMKVTDAPIYAFSFIHNMLNQLTNDELDAFVSAVISCIPDLVKLSRGGTYFLMSNHFLGRSQYIMSELRRFPESLFLYLKTVFEVQKTGSLNLSCLDNVDVLDMRISRKAQQQSTSIQTYLEAISSSAKLVRSNPIQVTDEMTELYFELLCQYDRGSVLKFLETSESYRVENCLRLCQEYGIVDAASFLFERVGDVGNALQLILSNLSEKFVLLDAVLRRGYSDTGLDNLHAIMKKKEVAEILDIVRACIGLCQRNTPRLEPDESEFLWFQLLDSFCEPLKDSSKAQANTKRKILKETLPSSELEEKKGSKINLKFSRSRKSVRRMRKLISIFIKEIVEGMVGYVRLPKIMLKLLSDNGNQEFGDFKLTILGMLGTYDFEKRILDTAKSLIEDDTYYTLRLLTKGASHGYAPKSLVCCLCNSLLAKNSTDSSIQVFSCGHAIHLNCEVQENGTSFGGNLPGCPICTTRKKSQISSGISVFVDNGLFSKSSSRIHQARGTPAMYPREHDSLDNPYSSHPVPRFELLSNLQRGEKFIQIENMPQLRLAPPAVYHDKLKKRSDVLAAESSSSRVSTTGKPNNNNELLRNVKVKGSSIRFPLKSSIFGKEKITRR